MMWILTLALLYLGSSVTHAGSEQPPKKNVCSVLFDVTKEEIENSRSATPNVNEKIQRYVLCHLLTSGVINADLEINKALADEVKVGSTTIKAKTFMECFEEAKKSDETKAHLITWKAAECYRVKHPEEKNLSKK